MKNPLVFLDVSIDGDPAEKMVFELFTDAAPEIAENFRALCTGENGNSPNTGRHLHYKGSFFHRIVKGLIAQGGDFLNRDGSFGESIYGEKFPDEPISKLKHDERGLLTMAVADRDERCSLFSITFKPLHQLDRKHLVFGKLVQGSEVLEKIDNVGEEDGTPSVAVKIINCGEFFAEKKSKGKRKKSSRRRRKRRRKYYSSDSETSLDSDTKSSDSDSDSESSYLSSSSDDKHRKRKRSSKRDKYKRGKKRSKRHEKKHRKRDRKSKHRSKRANDSETDSDTQSEGSAGGDAEVNGINQNHKPQAEMIPRNQPSLTDIAAPVQPEKSTTNNLFEKEAKFPMENGARQSNKIDPEANSGKAASNILNDHPRKSRSRSLSPKRSRSKSMSISHEKSPSPRQSVKSPNFTKSPQIISQRSRSISKGLPSSPSRSPENGINKRKISRSPIKSSRISVSPSRRRISRSPIRAHARRSYSRSLSKSPENGSPKRIRRGRGFSQRFSYARRYKTPSPDRSPVRSYRYGRNDHERYRRSPRYNRSPPRERTPLRKSPRRYRSPPPERTSPRRSPRRLRSPPRERSPLRYGNRKSRTRSPVSRSPSPYRAEMRTPPSRSRSPLVTKASPSLKRAHNKDRSSLSSSGSPPISNNNKGLVSYGERSLDAD